ncbi:DNA cytosine methyltransferase [Bacillus sp. BRMEA1]|uniref:DNA cytosine methyltransferase n=1 Tax=Neobacillus endophyticus TaxID=2738405 RepID=UPI001563D30C|nr:DNA cytosine methyltransferase [Neobacillus endophyticus]NRD80891.1 DNA cytosine methyltransferase [Neobacillus endophyticus]
MKQLLKRVYAKRQKAGKDGIWLQHLVCETAALKEGDPLYVKVGEEEIILQNLPFKHDSHIIHVSGRLNKTSNKRRPLVDSCGDKYASVLSLTDKVEIIVQKKDELSQIIVRPLQYKLMETDTIPSQKDERLRVLSLGAGCGIGTAALLSTNYFVPVMEIEMEDDSAEVLKHNYPNSLLFHGDMKDVHSVTKADVALVTMPCNESSTLGLNEGNVMNSLAIAAAKIILSSQAEVVFFENVPQWYKTSDWTLLNDLLKEEYPYFTEQQVEAWDFGCLSTRLRKYVVCFRDQEMFMNFQFPKPPKVRRRKLKDFLDGKHVIHEWKSLDTWMTNFENRDSSWRDRNLDKTFVTEDCTQINAIPKRYRGQSASSTYVLSKDKKHWRFLSVNEIRNILDVPEWFEFPKHIRPTRIYEMLGQSVSCQVFKAIANNIAAVFMKKAMKYLYQSTRAMKEKVEHAISISNNGQLELVI